MDRRLGGHIVILAGFVLGALFLLVLQSPLGVGLLGLCVMVGVLIGINILSGDDKLSKGEIRRAIGVSCVAVFFGLLAISNKIEYSEFSKDVLSNYWWVIMVIVGFYFGGRSAENIVTTIFEKWADVRTKQAEDAKIRANKKER
jgi:multisubunit Na+/H+ antiporter MnhB subunit